MIWEHLYDEHDENTSNVVDVYIRYLRNKIDKGFEPPLIMTRWGEGYMLRGHRVMKSIRLSLMVCFLGLLALAFGAVSVLVYHTTYQTLLAKKAATAELIEAQYRENCTKARERVDTALLAQATALSSVVDFPRKPSPHELTLGFALMNSLTPMGRFTVTAWGPSRRDGTFGLEKAPGPYGRDLYQRYYSERKFNDEALDQVVDPQVANFCQINSLLGPSYHSPSLRQDSRSLPFDAAAAPHRVIGWEYDEVLLGEDETLRRVTLTAPYPRFFHFGFFFPGPRSGRGPDSRDGDKDKPPPPRPEPTLRPAIVVQCAVDTARLNAILTDLAAHHEHEMTQLDAETKESLSSLSNRLLAIFVATFAATAVGGLILVSLGLTPLGRLSDAVSRVSEKDFRLQLGKGRLPVELKPIAARLGLTLEQLRQAFAREKQAAADISHELRTPLAALLTTIDVTLKKPRSAEDYREVLQDCRASGQQMSRLVERLLVLARLDAGVDPLRKRPFDLADLADQCTNMVRPLAQARSLLLTFENPGPTNLETDPDKLREVLNNLLHNAIQYNRPNGSVELKVVRHNGSVRMQVRDTGIGIPPEARDTSSSASTARTPPGKATATTPASAWRLSRVTWN